jgi:1,4-alpha-glucan branching enzyme
VGREEVQSFLISSAAFWVEKYHVDGLRVDAVAAMLYLDYDREPGEWIPNAYGDNRNLEAIAFFRKLNGHMRGAYPDVLMIAEESTAYGNLTTFDSGGLGFSLKWNMGWMNDVLDYKKEDYSFRRHHHTKTTFSLTYAFHEKYVLPISHDEVVHGKLSLLDRSPGDYWRKFADTRATLAYMMTHPGKKLMFMGCEYAPFREWTEQEELEWFMLDYPAHRDMQHYVAALNHFYLQEPSLYELDDSWQGFQWIDADNAEQSILSYRRIDRRGRELVVVINFTPTTYHGFRQGLPYHGIWEEVFNSDGVAYGGSGVCNQGPIRTEKKPWHGQGASATLTLPPLGALILKCKRRYPVKK